MCVDERCLEGSPDGVIYAVMCFLVRLVEALGAGALLTSSFAIIANTFPDRVATMFVRASPIEILSLSYRPIILVFRNQGSLRKSDGFTPNGGAEYKAVYQFPTNMRL